MSKNLRNTAAWRISIWTTLAFTLGTALAFLIVYFLVDKGTQERDDTWLSGEVQVLAQVSDAGGRQKNLPSPSQVISHDTVIRRK